MIRSIPCRVVPRSASLLHRVRPRWCTGKVSEPLVFQPGVAATAFQIEVGGWVIFELAMAVRQRWRLGARAARDPTGPVLSVCLAGSIFAAIRLGRADAVPWPGGRTWPVVCGLVLIAVGIALRAWSIASLGRFFQYRIQVQAEHSVVTTGPYRYVRHPSYSGIGLVLIGIALATGDVLSLPVVAVLAGAGLAVRIRAEERQLTEALGAEYERFAAERKRVVPGVW
jgi:protein-S-isoprenylcysteine O-methyltransferase Ste14